MIRLLILLSLIICLSCNGDRINNDKIKGMQDKNLLYEPLVFAKPLLVTRFKSLDDFKTKVKIKYFTRNNPNCFSSMVQLNLRNKKSETLCELKSGLSQVDILNAKNGGILDKIKLTLRSPYAIRNRKNLEKAFILARRRSEMFGMRDVAFFDLARAMSKHINTRELAYKSERDSGEKGYINTFNHVVAQAIITSFFSQELADFMANAHERKNMPELISGHFTQEQLQDPNNYPEDNYVDIINNKIGQEIGLVLSEKHKINSLTSYSTELLTNYLNDIQSYLNWSFGIGFDSFNSDDELIVRFTYKLNQVLNRAN